MLKIGKAALGTGAWFFCWPVVVSGILVLTATPIDPITEMIGNTMLLLSAVFFALGGTLSLLGILALLRHR